MAATWTPPWFQRYLDSRFAWRLRFAWLPYRSSESNQLIWLKQFYYGQRLIDGPAGESPVKLEKWLTEEEYTWFALTNA